MSALQYNDDANEVVRAGAEWGYKYNWNFFGGMVRANWGGDVEEYIRECKNNLSGLANCEWFETKETGAGGTIALLARGAALVAAWAALSQRTGGPRDSTPPPTPHRPGLPAPRP